MNVLSKTRIVADPPKYQLLLAKILELWSAWSLTKCLCRETRRNQKRIRKGTETRQRDPNIKLQGNDKWSSERGQGRPKKF